MAACLLVAGCIIPRTPRTVLSDFKFVSVEVVSERDTPDKTIFVGPEPRTPMLKVSVTTGTNLPDFTRALDRAINFGSWPCRQQAQSNKDRYSSDSHVYDKFGEVAHDPDAQAMRAVADGTNGVYHVYIAIASAGNPNAPTPYDLGKSPEDVCVRIYGGSTNLMQDTIFQFNSNDIVVSRDAIRAAIAAGATKAN